MKDLFGKAILDYQTQNSPENLITETNISEEDEMQVAYLFRSFKEMPKIEQSALKHAQGKVLDVGCGAGSHSLYLQNERNLNVTPIDISENAIKACQLRGLASAKVLNILNMDDSEKFDTILLLMNGTGIFGKLENTPKFLQKLKSLLNKNGQILIDSTDLIYMFDEDDSEGSEGGRWIPGDMDYYGELEFSVTYKGEKEDSFPWLYLDYNTLQNAAFANGLECKMILEGENYDYLAQLSSPA